MKFYLVQPKKGVDAIADYNEKSGAFIVLKGSKINPEMSTRTSFSGAEMVEKLRYSYVKDGVVIEDVVFSSPSAAGNFVTGRSTNGRVSWKDKNGCAFGTVVNN